jgi:hypothetical protein
MTAKHVIQNIELEQLCGLLNINNQWDTFTFTLYNSNANPLLSINFNVTADNTGDTWGLSYSTYGHNGVTNTSFIKSNNQQLAPLQNMQLAYLGFDVLNIGQTNQSLVMYNTYWTNSQGQPSIILTNSLLGSDYSGIDTKITALAATWQLRDTTTTNFVDGSDVVTVYPNFADNTLLVENVTISIPEPHIYILLSLAGIIIVIRRNHFA